MQLTNYLKPRTALIRRTKSKVKKVIANADILFSAQNQIKSQEKKRSSGPQISYIPFSISREQGLYFCKCPRTALYDLPLN